MAKLRLNDSVQFWSASYRQWIDCVVTHEDAGGAVQVSCKPNCWIPVAEQEQKLRHAAAPTSGSDLGGGTSAGPAPQRHHNEQPVGGGYVGGAPAQSGGAVAPSGGYARAPLPVAPHTDRAEHSTMSTPVSTSPSKHQMSMIRKILDSPRAIKRHALEQFRRFDENRDKLLDPDELQACLDTLKTELGIPSVESNQIQMLIQKFDNDGNGALDLGEFEDFMKRVLIKSRQHFEQWKVHCEFFVEKQAGSPNEHYEVIRQLGEGTFGITHLVADRRTALEGRQGELRVLKTVNKAKANMPPQELEQEIATLRTLDHPHIIKLFEYYEDVVNIYLVMEQAQGGELLHVIEELYNQGWRVSERWSATVMQQVLEAIAYCHGRRLMHKDLKAENIMLLRSSDSSLHPHAVVIDLGLAEMFGSSAADPRGQSLYSRAYGSSQDELEDKLYRRIQSRKVGGTPTTMAPEVWRAYMGRGSFGMKCDVYSLGVVLFQLLTGNLPFMARIEPMEWLDKICKGPDRDLLAGCSQDAQGLVLSMLAYDPLQRPTARQALGATWFSDKAQNVDVRLNEKQMMGLLLFEKKSELQKAVTLQVASQLKAADLPKINAIFRKYDVDNTGCLDSNELINALKEMGIDEVTAGRAAKAIDLDKNGEIEYTEFVAACISMFDDRHEAYLWQIFRKLDVERTGYLTNAQIEQLLTDSERHGLGFSPSRSEVKNIIDEMDRDKNGEIKFEDFLHYLNPHSSHAT